VFLLTSVLLCAICILGTASDIASGQLQITSHVPDIHTTYAYCFCLPW